MADHELGSMDITQHQNTWKGFVKLVSWSTITLLVVVAALIFIFG